MTTILRLLPAALILCAMAAQAQPRLAIIGASEGNVFRQAAAQLGLSLDAPPVPTPEQHEALLICAPQYPLVVPLAPALQQALERFLAAGKSAYLEYTPMAGALADKPETAVYERLCLPGDQGAAAGRQHGLEQLAARPLPPNTLMGGTHAGRAAGAHPTGAGPAGARSLRGPPGVDRAARVGCP
jgi:hypothetical protein